MVDTPTKDIPVVLFPRTRSTGEEGKPQILRWPTTALAAWTSPCAVTNDREKISLLMCGTNNGRRKDENITSRTALVFDVDVKREGAEELFAWYSRSGLVKKDFKAALGWLKKEDISHAWHTTHSHIEDKDGGRFGWRLWLPLADAVTDFTRWREVNHAFNVRVFAGTVDVTCYNPERLMRLPAKHPDRPFLSGSHVGRLYDYHKEGIALWNSLSAVERTRKRGEKMLASSLPKSYTRVSLAEAHPLPEALVNDVRANCARIADKGKNLAPETVSALHALARVEALQRGARDNGLTGLVGIFSQRFLQHETRPLLESLLLPVLQRTHEEAPDDPIKPAFPTPRALLEHVIDLVESRRTQNLSTTGQSFVSEVESSLIQSWTRGERRSAMSEEELQALAQSRGLDLETFKRQIFVAYRNDTYVWQVHGYGDRPLVMRELTIDVARAALAALGIARRRFDEAKGEFVALSLEGIIARYAATATRIRASYLAAAHYYDVRSSSFVEAVGKRRPLQPTYHAGVHEWLSALGGDRLLAWVASFSRLSKPTAILLLVGPRSAGKGLFANGLARVFEHGVPARASEALSDSFNGELADTPFIWGDEEVPKKGNRSLGARLREIISSPSTPLRRKHLPNVEIEGYVRVLITANNANILRDFSNDVPSEDDLAAIAERVFIVDADIKARDVLERVAREGDLDEWRSGNAIAEHALWLADNFEYKKGVRFLVEGGSEDAVRTLLVADGFTNQILEWFVRFAMLPSNDKTRAHPAELAAVIRNGLFTRVVDDELELYTTLEVINTTWHHFKPAYRMGTTEPFLVGLNAVCYKARAIAQRRGSAPTAYWKVRIDYLEFFANRVGISSEALKKAMLEKIDIDARLAGDKYVDDADNVLDFPRLTTKTIHAPRNRDEGTQQ